MNYLTIAKWAIGVIGGLAIAWAVYAGIIRPITKPNPSTQQKAETIYNYTIQPRHTFGCSAFLIRREDVKDISLDNSNTAK